jgi:hypothetical protein
MISRSRISLVVVLWFVLAGSGQLDAQLPPMENLKLWLDAGQGVTEAGGSVIAWDDQSENEPLHDGTASRGIPVIELVEFPSEFELPVMRFDGGSGFDLESDDDMYLGSMSIYAVAAVDEVGLEPESRSRLLIANYVNVFGFGLGMSDSREGVVKWFSAGPSDSYEPTPGGDMQAKVPVLLTATHSGTEKRLYVNRQIAGDPVPIGGPSYTGGDEGLPTLTVGWNPGAGGQFWDGYIAEVLVYDSVDETQRDLVEGYLQGKYFSALDITGHPESQNISEGDPVEFRVGFIGQAPFEFQWLRDGVEIPGATEKTYVLDHVVRGDDGARFSVRVSSVTAGLSEVSNEAILLVIDLDDEDIELVGARRNVLNNREVIVEFSEPALPVTAAEVANYAIDNGITVDGVELSDSPNLVYLATSAIEPGATYTLTVNGVQDRAENSIAADSQAEIVIHEVDATPPADDLVLWLAADERFVELDDQDQVLTWTDLAREDNNAFREVDFGSSYPALTTHDFTPGERSVLLFDGDTGMGIENEAALRLTEISMYAVFPVGPTSGSIMSLWDFAGRWGTGWEWRVLGKPEDSPSQINLFTGQLTCGGFSNTTSPFGGIGGGYQILAATISNESNMKRLYADGAVIAEWPLGNTDWANCEDGSPYVPAMTYNNLERASIATLRQVGVNRQHVGEIAEILIYGAVDEAQRLEVEDYLRTKYFETTPRTVFRRGDWDGSGIVDITDSLNRLGFLFLGTTPTKCDEAGDFDNSGAIDISDSLNELTHLFLGTVIPPPPGTMECGPDPLELIPEGGGLPAQVVLSLGCIEYPNADLPDAVGCP